jgi:FeS assembly SUF system protein
MSEDRPYPDHLTITNALAENGEAETASRDEGANGSAEGDTEGGEDAPLVEQIIEELRSIYDPEIPVPILDLGLIYEIEIDEERAVHITMTLTAPNCPAAETLPRQVEQKIRALPDVTDAEVEIVFEPPFTPEMMTDEARMQLGMM